MPPRTPPTPPSIDPDNRLLYRMPIRRLEAEAIRDSMLAVSGRLSGRMHGQSVLPYLTPYMEGRGKPQSGPLDGEGRRSIYINARRNFLTPLLLAFDYPVTFTPIGRRGASAIPSQALTLMNDPFVVGQATRWAESSLAETSSSTVQRIEACTRPLLPGRRLPRRRPPPSIFCRSSRSATPAAPTIRVSGRICAMC